MTMPALRQLDLGWPGETFLVLADHVCARNQAAAIINLKAANGDIFPESQCIKGWLPIHTGPYFDNIFDTLLGGDTEALDDLVILPLDGDLARIFDIL